MHTYAYGAKPKRLKRQYEIIMPAGKFMKPVKNAEM